MAEKKKAAAKKKSPAKKKAASKKHSSKSSKQRDAIAKRKKESIKQKEGTKKDNGHVSKLKDVMGFPSEIDGTEIDIILEVPEVKVDKILINVSDIDARVNLNVEAMDFLKVKVGVHVHLDEVEVLIKGVRAEAYLQVRLERIKSIVKNVMNLVDNNAEVLVDILHPLTKGLGNTLGETVDGVSETLHNLNIEEIIEESKKEK